MKKAFIPMLIVLSLIFSVSCENEIKSNNQSFPSWLEGKTLRIKGENKRAVLIEDDNYYYVTCSGSFIYVDNKQGEVSSYEEKVSIESSSNEVKATSSSTEYIFTTTGEDITLEIKGDESLSGIYSTDLISKSNWPLEIKCYEGPNKTEDVACRIVTTPRGLYYLLCSNYDKYKDSSEPFQCEKDKWFAFVETISIDGDNFTISNSRGLYSFKRNSDGTITLNEGENTFILREKSFDYSTLIKDAEVMSSHDHNFVSVERVKPSCSDGYELFECECGKSYKNVISATGEHNYVLVKQIEGKEHTKESLGEGLFKCEICSHEKTDTICHQYEEFEDPENPKEAYLKNGKYYRVCKLCKKEDRTNARINYRDTIKLGKIEFNGEKKDIEWLILKVDGNDALMISKYILYSSGYAKIDTGDYSNNDSWSNNPLIRQELNTKYYNEFFTDEEKTKIKDATNGDKMFLFSNSDAVYFDYYDKLGRSYSSGNSFSDYYYWIRDFSNNNYPCIINGDGKKMEVKNKEKQYGVRPCIWVKDWRSLIIN